MSTFRSLTTRGAFVPASMPGSTSRTFTALPVRPTSTFTAGLAVRPPADEPGVADGDGQAEADAAALEETEFAAAEAEPAEAAEPTPPPAQPVAAPVVGSAVARMEAAALQEALAAAERAAAEFAEREALRAAEHAQLLADLDAQKQRARTTNERLGQLAGELVRTKQALIDEVRATAGTLLLTGARRLAGEALREQPGLLEGLVTEIVDSMAADSVTLRVNPADSERLSAAFGDRVRVVADPLVAAGCIVQGDAGSVDASIDAGLGALAAEVTAWKRTA